MSRKNKVLATSKETTEQKDKWYIPYHYDGRERDINIHPGHWFSLSEYYFFTNQVQIAATIREDKKQK